MSKQKRHHKLLNSLKDHQTVEFGNVQYITYKDGSDTVFYIHGSNERKDWGINALYFGLFFHIGYALMASKIKKFVASEGKVTLIGHSFGAGTASVLYWLLGRRVKEMILIGCPPSYTWLNPLIPIRCTNYRVTGDPVTHANIIRPLFRQCKKTTWLPSQSNNPIENHKVSSYIKALEV